MRLPWFTEQHSTLHSREAQPAARICEMSGHVRSVNLQNNAWPRLDRTSYKYKDRYKVASHYGTVRGNSYSMETTAFEATRATGSA